MKKEKLKVFEIIPTLGGGGAEKVVIDLADGLDRELFDVTIVSLYDSSYAIKSRVEFCERKGIRIVYLDKALGFDFGLLIRLIRLIRCEKPDVIHTHLYSYKYVILLDSFFSYKHIHTFHSIIGYEKGIFNLLLHLDALLGKTTFVVLVKRFVSEMKNRYHINDNRIKYVNNGIDLTAYPVIQRMFDKSDITFVTVGSLIPVKNHRCLLLAFVQLEKERHNRDKLYIVGDGSDEAKLKQLCVEHKIDKNVIFTGNVPNVVDYLSIADIYVCSSHFEGVSLAILEAASTGLPLICSNVGGTTDVVGDSAVMFEDDDVAGLVGVMREMAINPKYRQNYSIRAVKMSEDFSKENMISNYQNIYLKS